MAKFQRHLFICVNEREPDDPRGCCAARGGMEIAAAFKKALYSRGLKRIVRPNKAGCLDQCALGVTVVVYPEGVWYGHVTVDDVDEIVDTVRRIAPSFGGINLEDISAPRSFEVEARLQDIGIPVFHDDQHGTAIVALAALMNAARVVGKELTDMTVVVSGAGAAGIAISRLLRCTSIDPDVCKSVGNVLVTDSKGIISSDRADLSPAKQELLGYSNRDNRSGSVHDAIVSADAFIGVSAPNVLDRDDVRAMADSAIVFGLANPDPEIMPAEALAAGAAIAGTGRSDLPNQVNNVLGFPGIFRGALDARATRITPRMNLAAADAIAASISDPTPDRVIPAALDASVAQRVAAAVTAAV